MTEVAEREGPTPGPDPNGSGPGQPLAGTPSLR